MDTYEVEVSNNMKAAPELIYRVLADYHNEHPRILPKPYFTSLVVEQGGFGAGTIMEVRMKAMGIVQMLRLHVTEPKPGSVLQEEDPIAGVLTTFLVEPDPDRVNCHVTIRTEWKKKKGFRGFMEQLANPFFGRHIFSKELDILKAYCEEKQQAAGN